MQKIIFGIIIVAFVLIAFAIGVASGFFANEAFSMFFILSKEDAQNAAAYVAVAAIALTIVALGITLFKKQKNTLSETAGKSRMAMNQEDSEVVHENQSFNPAAKRVVNASIAQTLKKKTIKSSATKKQSTAGKTKMLTCPNCERQFSKPVSSKDYELKDGRLQLRVSKSCPHCNQLLDAEYKMVQYDEKDKTLKT